MPRKRKYRPKAFESTGASADTSANIYESMLTSPAFMDLSKNQRLLYVYCKAQFYGKRKPGKDYPDIEQLQGDDLFYFNLALAEKYGLYSRSNNREFYKDRDVLEEHGFIKTISNGRLNRKKSIYQFSDEWRTWSDTS